MEFNLIVKPEAQDDIKDSLDWYIEQGENLPAKFLERLDESLTKIQKNPKHYQKRYGEVRIVFLKKFPYGIYYTIEENNIFVHAVFHNKQNPKTAKSRVG